MTQQQIIDVCEKYNNFLINFGIAEAIRENDKPESLRHIKWMVEEIPKLLDVGKIEKANRWLGFVQGVFWVKKLLSIDELKNDNR